MMDTITAVCKQCTAVKELEVDIANFAAWQHGEMLIQVALPNLPPEDRELIKLGTCGACWNAMLGICV
jgi:hypothetical protein